MRNLVIGIIIGAALALAAVNHRIDVLIKDEAAVRTEKQELLENREAYMWARLNVLAAAQEKDERKIGLIIYSRSLPPDERLAFFEKLDSEAWR